MVEHGVEHAGENDHVYELAAGYQPLPTSVATRAERARMRLVKIAIRPGPGRTMP